MKLNTILKLLKLLMALLIMSNICYGQEILCADQLDNDNDGFVDTFDSDCPCDSLLNGYHDNCNPTCEYVFNSSPLSLALKYTSNVVTHCYTTPIVGDIDNDGIQEILISRFNVGGGNDGDFLKDIVIVNAATGTQELIITTPYYTTLYNAMAIADVDNDGYGEIIMASTGNGINTALNQRYLFCYEHDGTLKWKSNVQYGYNINSLGYIGFADFNNDGNTECYIQNQIFNAQTGVLLMQGGSLSGKGTIGVYQTTVDFAQSVAAELTDTLSNSTMELAAGNTVYMLNFTNTANAVGNTMTSISAPVGVLDGWTSIADIDIDGKLDIIVTGFQTGGLNTGNTLGFVSVWNPKNASIIASASIPITGAAANRIGIAFIGDIDNDCQPEIGVTRSNRLYCYEYNSTTTLAQKWVMVHSDGSGLTGMTLFDFNQDGNNEIVYRDETQLRIINGAGANAVNIATLPCYSYTAMEHAVVADIDNDGAAEICVVCSSTNVQGYNSRLRVYESGGQPWASARKVWNQHAYHVTNINDNLTVPKQEQSNAIDIGTSSCCDKPYNYFLQQATTLGRDGCPMFAASDLAISIIQDSCLAANQVQVKIRVENVSPDHILPLGLNIYLYNGNPTMAGATLLNTNPVNIATSSNLAFGASETITVILTNPPTSFNLYVIGNSNSGIVPISLPNSNTQECNYVNNLSSKTISCVPLPINLIDFYGHSFLDEVSLEWIVGDIQENGIFYVEKFTYSSFETMGIIETNSQNTYNFIDRSPLVGNNRYRLKMIDTDGVITYSNEINVEFNAQIRVLLFPNPTENLLNISFNNYFDELLNIQIFDIYGNIVYINNGNLRGTLKSIDLSKLPQGVYGMKIIVGNQLFTRKLIKK